MAMLLHHGLLFFLLLLAVNNYNVAAVDESSDSDENSTESEQQQQTTESFFATTAEIFDEEKVEPTKPLASCDVFDPFKVLPTEPDHFQIGGAFSLHREDCLELNPSSVQEVVAVQWAMAYWNEQQSSVKKEANDDGSDEDDSEQKKQQKSTKGRPKLGLFAGDSCSRPKEAISQSLRFLDSMGYHEPGECVPSLGAVNRKSSASPKLIGILSPKDRESAEAVAQVLRPSSVPIGVYSPAAAQAFTDAKMSGFISTVPLFEDYVRTLVQLLRMIGSDLVSIVDFGNNDLAPSDKLLERLRQSGISVAEVLAFDHPMLANILSASDSQIIVSLVSNKLLADAGFGEMTTILDMRKLWITLELELDGNEDIVKNGPLVFLPENESRKGNGLKLQFVTIRRQQRYLADFNAYFLRVLMSNYEYYSLLNAYVQQVYNCSNTQQQQERAKVLLGKRPSAKAICSPEQLEPKRLARLHRQSSSIESSILLIYALARAAERINANAELQQKCNSPTTACFQAIRAELLKFTEGPNGGRVPPGFADQLNNMRFFETAEGIIQMVGIELEAIFPEREGRDGGNVYKLLQYQTGVNAEGKPIGTFEKFQVPQRLQHINSQCRPFRPYCLGKCAHAMRRRDDQTFLSIPQQFSLYLAAIFDFQSGTDCKQLRRDNPSAVSLPLAFVHTISKSILFTSGTPIDIGMVLADSCSNARTLLEFLVDSERNCYQFTQVDRNWTIADEATIGYVFGSEEIGAAQSGVLQAMFSNPNSTPVVTIAKAASDESASMKEDALFNFGPSPEAMASALAKFLRQMHWTYVNVVLDRSDAASMAIYKQFERIAAGICTADLTIIGKEASNSRRRDASNDDEEQSMAKNKEFSTGHKTAEQRLGITVPNANVTLVFSAAKPAAEFMSARLRDEFMGAGALTNVHVMVGDAHDFFLHDLTNLAQYAGTVSFQAKDVTSVEFQNWLRSITPLTLPEVWYWRHVEENWHCALSRANIARFHGRMCTGEELLDVPGMGRLTRAGYLARGVERMLMAIEEAHKKLCRNEKLCDAFIHNGRRIIREIMAMKLAKDMDEFEVYQLIPTGHQKNFEYKLFAKHSAPILANKKDAESNNKNFHFTADYRSFSNGIQASEDGQSGDSEKQPIVVSRCRAPFCKCLNGKINNFGDFDGNEPNGRASYIRREPASKGNDDSEELLLIYENSADDPEIQELRTSPMERQLEETLRTVFFVLSALLCALGTSTMLLILVKMYQRRIKGHQSLGLLLLAAICSLFAGAALFAQPPTSDLICHLRIALHALAHTMCFGVVVVKAIQLRNAETLALMGASAQQISYWNYWLLLAFIFAVQIVICLKWLLLEPFGWATTSSSTIIEQQSIPTDRVLLCSHSSPNFVLAQIYIFVLLLLSLLLSAQNRNIKRNYKEAKWLFITSLGCTLILCAWATSHILISPIYLDLITVLELQLTGALLLACIFGPKLYVLLFYEPVVVECVYGGSVNAGLQGDKAVDLFEAELQEPAPSAQDSFSPTLSNRSSALLNGKRSPLNGTTAIVGTEDEEEAKVTSAFQTVLRKKTGGSSSSKTQGSGTKHGRAHSTQSNKNQQLNLLNSMPTSTLGQKEAMPPAGKTPTNPTQRV